MMAVAGCRSTSPTVMTKVDCSHACWCEQHPDRKNLLPNVRDEQHMHAGGNPLVSIIML